MMRFARSTKVAMVGALAVSLLVLAQGALARTYPADWPHAASDLKPNPKVKFGRLPNGMRYAIMKNNTPIDATSMRLVIDAGSIQESDAERGVAHLLEHMAFRGSKRVPDGEVVKSLERMGLQFGADTNASTSFTQTIYKFDLPKSDTKGIDEALLLMREIASELNITDEALATERGVVLSEYRLSMNTPAARSALESIAATLPGRRVAQRFPIGTPETLDKASAALIRGYYQRFYRPERATLLVVGNVDEAQLEKKIAEKFSDWKGTGRAAPDPDMGAAVQGQSVKAYFEKDMPTTIALNWTSSYQEQVETLASTENQILSEMGIAILNQRLRRAAMQDGAEFTLAQVSRSNNFLRSARLATLSVVTTPEKWRSAVQSARWIFESTLEQGVAQEEVDRSATALRAILKNLQATEETRSTVARIERLANTLEDNLVFDGPELRNARSEPVLKALSVEKVNAVLREMFRGTPTAFLTSAAPIANVEADLGGLLSTRAGDGKAPAPAAQVASVWPYTSFGAEGKVASRSEVKDLGTTFVEFANHVVLAVKPSTLKKGEIRIVVKVAGGLLRSPRDRPVLQAMVGALIGSGLEALDQPSVANALAGKAASVAPQLGEAHLILNGATTPRDLDTQLQLLAAYLTAPGLRSGPLEQMKQVMLAMLPQLQNQPMVGLALQSPFLLHGNDARWAFTTPEDLRSVKLEELKSWLFPQLKEGSVEVSIMGDVTVDAAIAAVAKTMGAIATRPKPVIDASLGKDVKFPAGNAAPVVMRHKGAKDKAALMVAWPAPDRRADLPASADALLLSAVVQNRLVDLVRGKLGAGYAPQCAYDGAWFTPGYGTIVIRTDAKPDQTQMLLDAIAEVSTDLRSKPVSKDELDRAVQPIKAASDQMMQSNSFGMMLVSPAVDSKPTEFLRTQHALITAVTPDRLQRLAQKYLTDDKAVRLLMLPE